MEKEPSDHIWAGGESLMRRYRILLKKLISEIPGEKLAVLDAGCWEKQYRPYFAGRDAKYVGLDIAPGKHVDVVGDIHKMPFRDGTFDVVMCMEVLEHVGNPWKATQEIRRVLKPGGHLVASAPFIFPLHACPYDFWRFTDEGWKKLLKDFKDVRVYRVGNSATSLTATISLYAAQWPKFLFPLKGLIYLTCNIAERILYPFFDNGVFTPNYMVVARKAGGKAKARSKR